VHFAISARPIALALTGGGTAARTLRTRGRPTGVAGLPPPWIDCSVSHWCRPAPRQRFPPVHTCLTRSWRRGDRVARAALPLASPRVRDARKWGRGGAQHASTTRQDDSGGRAKPGVLPIETHRADWIRDRNLLARDGDGSACTASSGRTFTTLEAAINGNTWAPGDTIEPTPADSMSGRCPTARERRVRPADRVAGRAPAR
jgi:hypothetical protein